MVESPAINLKITNIYKYFLYIGAIILILSLFIDIKGANATTVRSFSVWILILGSWIWFADDILQDYADYQEVVLESEASNYSLPHGLEDKMIGFRIVKNIFRFIMVAAASYFLSWLLV